jgi:effector-binding domain-containing protein
MRRMLVFAVLLSAAVAFAQAGEKKAEKKGMHAASMAKTTMAGEISVKTIPAMTAATVMEKATDFVPKDGYKPGMDGAMQAWTSMLPDAYDKLGAWMKAGGMPMGPSFAIYYEDPTKVAAKDLTCKVGFPTMKDAKVKDPVKLEEFPETQSAVVQVSGPYNGLGAIYDSLMKWIPAHGYDFAGPPVEVYIKSEHDKIKPADYFTEIRFPVKKAEPATPSGDKSKVGEAPKAPDAPKTADVATPPVPSKPADAPKAGGGK